ncbi:DUF397 domain-containing protein [Amycolatopsis sp. H20-H5]|uniref:DUF397 domain-containing protein n=1 Tax=Amycolatopsis sp. H20-H5 TaxID=3046309 RepID=UPI002DBFED58|nr:DUF397 domain-containing protein [Amycolatopsis sp. H20-H5]MEC3980866.1 DUF397 domain-containing protein [Amycolatopsis sp. H20-H5]
MSGYEGPDHLTWKKSSYSGADANTTECVEVAFFGDQTFVRDSKDLGGGSIRLPKAAWASLIRVTATESHS